MLWPINGVKLAIKGVGEIMKLLKLIDEYLCNKIQNHIEPIIDWKTNKPLEK